MNYDSDILEAYWKCRLSSPTGDLENKNLQLNKFPRRFVCTFKFEKHWSKKKKE